MKRSYGTFAGALVAVGMCLWATSADALFGKKDKAKADVAPAADTQVGPAASAAGEKIVHTFADQAQMDEFAKLWQQRQGMVLRMTVLQSYWNQEQAALQELNQKLSADYHLDTNKNYRFDNQQKVLIEVEAPPAPEAPAQ